LQNGYCDSCHASFVEVSGEPSTEAPTPQPDKISRRAAFDRWASQTEIEKLEEVRKRAGAAPQAGTADGRIEARFGPGTSLAHEQGNCLPNCGYCLEAAGAQEDARTLVEDALRNLMAVIFRDGGHRAATFKSLAEAAKAAEGEVIAMLKGRDTRE
jgi:hypothetical protein